MMFPVMTASQKRLQFREKLKSGRLLVFPGAFSPLVAMLIEKKQFDGVYISGSVLSNDLGYPDIGLTTQTEVAYRGRQIARSVSLPSLIDIDTGFGEPMNVTRTVQEMIEMGMSAVHMEDQMNPKRCGHLDNKSLVAQEEMIKKIKAAERGKTLDSQFLIMARTDARASEGLDAAIKRANAYVDAGAEAIFPEALQDEKEFEVFRKAVNVPLLANMTEFGKSKLLTQKQLSNLGFNIVIYPVSTLRLAMKAVDVGLTRIQQDGTQEAIVGDMQTRKELYELTRYEEYNDFDQSIFNFKI